MNTNNATYNIEQQSNGRVSGHKEVAKETTAGNDNESHEVNIVLVNEFDSYNTSFNTPPTKDSPMIYQRNHNGALEYVFEMLTFGLVPFWAKPQDPEPVSKGKHAGEKYSKELQKYQSRYFNCRKETLAENKLVWASAKGNRCIIPISGYYEWLKKGNEKIPYYIHSPSRSLIYLAGFYSHNKNYHDNFQVKGENGYLSSFTVITGPASKDDTYDLSWLHSRKPIMLLPGTKEWDTWLDPTVKWSPDMLDTCLNTSTNKAYDQIKSHIVSKDVGNSTNQGEYLIQEVKQEKSPQKLLDMFFSKSPSKTQRDRDVDDVTGSPKSKKVKTEPKDRI